MKIEEAIETLHNIVGCCSSDPEYVALETLISALKERHSARHGRWIPHKTIYRTPFATNYDCSVCGKESFYTRYCPNCGAKMDEEENK